VQPAARKNHAALLDVGKVVYERQAEIYDPSDGEIDTLGARHLQLWYPQTFQTPQGIFVSGPQRDSIGYVYDIDATEPYWSAYPIVEDNQNSGFVGGAAVQFEPGRILKAGSRDQELGNTPATAQTATINLREQEFYRSAFNFMVVAIRLGPRFIQDWLGRKSLQREVRVQQLVQARARLARAEHDLKLARIVSPIDGVVLERYDRGDATLPAGHALMLLGDLA